MARGNTIALVMSGTGKPQSDKDTPLDVSELDTRLTLTSRNYVETSKTIEEVLDCVGEEVVSREVTRIIRRLSIEGEFVPAEVAVLEALAMGGSAAPTGATANTTQTVTLSGGATGLFKLALNYDGYDVVTGSISATATAAQFKQAIEKLPNVGTGNTTVAKVGQVFTVVFVGKRAAANIPVFVEDETDLTGTVTVLQTVAGSQKSHNITELPSGEYQPPYTTFGLAFEDEPGSERLLVGAIVDNVVNTGAVANGKVTYTADIICIDVIPAPGLVVPECNPNTRPIRTGDCALIYNSGDITENLRDFVDSFANNTLTGNSAYPGRGVNPKRLERASRRTRSLAFSLLGGVTETLYQEAEGNPEAGTVRPIALRIGVDGNCIIRNIPNGLTELAAGNGGLDFDQESEEAITRFLTTPTKVAGVAPTNIVAKISQATQLLT